MADNNFNSTVESLFKGMDSFLTTKTVVGDAVKFDDGTIILPLVEVSFGVGAGAFAGDAKNNAGGGMGGKIIPSSVLVIQNGSSKLVNIKDQDSITKILDMVPDIINKFTKKDKDKQHNDNVDENLNSKVDEALKHQSSMTRYE
ncbi:MAG TPA: sporulation protein [Clostridiales bacterium]|nr:sporulation protein [Clostridiales bacterium]